MVYSILQSIMRKSLRFHYKAIEIKNMSQLPPSGPTIIAASHPNSFLDAIIVAAFCKRKLFFLARSDVFKNPIANAILRSLNLIPIYRLSEGKNHLSKNDITFKHCHKLLEKGEALLIFVEGISLIDKKIRPPKKGLARIAFGAEESNGFQLGVKIMPLGINYEKAKSYHNNVWLRYGSSINLKALHSNYLENKQGAYKQLNKQLFNDLKYTSLESKHENILDLLLELCPTLNFDELKAVSKKIDQFQSHKINHLNELCKNANRLKQEANISTIVLQKDASRINKTAIKIMFILAYAFCFLPLILSKYICNKFVYLDEFYDSFRVVLNTLFVIIWSASITLVLMTSFHPLFILLPFIIYQFGGINHNFYKLKNYNRLKRRTQVRAQLLKIKTELINQLEINP